MKQLAAIGIKTTANYLDGGKLEIDEAKLKKAIEEDPASVENLFRGTGDSTSSKGIVQRLYDDVSGTIDKLNERAGKATYTNQQFTIGKNLDDVSKKITTFTDRLKQIEDRYYNQFTAMEQAIQKANSQMSYLMQYFGGGQ
jgi:flagellar hook-associated protein 2